MNTKTKRRCFLFTLAIGTLILPAFAFAGFDYTPMEKIPLLTENSGDFVKYIQAIYNLGIWTIGICALLMIMIGGFMYITSAGNNASMEKAKGIITDAIIGILMALTAYLLLYIINPDLVNIKLVSLSGTGSGTGPGAGPGTGPGSGKCVPAESGYCAPENLTNCSWDPQKASAICYAESGGKETVPSGSDVCKDKNPFSWGLFQINLTCQCPNAFDPPGNCVNYACSVPASKKSTYDSCVEYYKNPANNIAKACEIYKQGGWGRWGVNKNCGF